MPIFQVDIGGGVSPPPDKPTNPVARLPPDEGNTVRRKLSEESIRTELCEGPALGSPHRNTTHPLDSPNDHSDLPTIGAADRVDLIERLKREQNSTWLPNQNDRSQYSHVAQHSPQPSSPSAQAPNVSRAPSFNAEYSTSGIEIERPRSALHSGDFTEEPQHSRRDDQERLRSEAKLYSSERQPWLATSPPRHFTAFQLDGRFPSPNNLERDGGLRSIPPSLSSSHSSNFILMPPTSPLVQSESNDEIDSSSSINPIDISLASRRNPRRHTLQSSHSIQSSPSIATPSSFSRLPPQLRRDNTFPYQAHQPRRSLTSNPNWVPSSLSPQTPGFARPRRPSITSDSSPLQHAAMVGSYEESILRGRMSTTPSKPLNFLAQIGVLGIGKCKSSLRCPPHVTLPFPAVFYSYETTNYSRTGRSEDGPSPYVGQIDLENGLPNPDEAKEGKRKRHSSVVDQKYVEDIDVADTGNIGRRSEREVRRAEKQKRRSSSPKAPHGGSYRIPERGQVQIIIKNPNKTAVKLFLVPYNLAGMEPGTKTFLRQRSYSTGPIIDAAVPSPSEPATNSLDRPTLRYLVHLQICCPSRGRYYLYKSIRVVFANRVPDGKEKLRNEITMPEPRFSVYKPGRDFGLNFGLPSIAGASLAAEKAYRRRSAGFGLGNNRVHDPMEGVMQALEKDLHAESTFHNGQDSGTAPIQPIPFSLYRREIPKENSSTGWSLTQEPSEISDKISQTSASQDSNNPKSWNSEMTGIEGYDKLNKGDLGYGGNPFRTSPDGSPKVAEGLLAKKLRDLGVGALSQQDRMDNI
ncbi:hypothetical protein F5884DRAFT_428221 [Xylogone sp. PMI_703]|nr:hypothetical protein F5884DRAFT_428221 [Xylogone sp. PMI_703]